LKEVKESIISATRKQVKISSKYSTTVFFSWQEE